MIINSISLRNFKSYGNNVQKLTFPPDGSLILLSGKNGNGKSSLLESIDFSLYGVVRGKNTKRVPNYILPNRINKNLETEIDFINYNNDRIILNRKLAPKSIKVLLNDNDITSSYDLMNSQDKDNLIGFEYNTYKSLVSLNLADFANFINLDTDTKKKLLNKLFNIQEIDSYQSIAKELLKNEHKRKEKLEKEISNNSKNIEMYNNSLVNIRESLNVISKGELKNILMSYKPLLQILKVEMDELTKNLEIIKSDIKNKNEIIGIKDKKILEENLLYKDLLNKIDIFNNGNCPYCGSYLKDEDHMNQFEKLKVQAKENYVLLKDLKLSRSNMNMDLSNIYGQKKELEEDLYDKKQKFDGLYNEYSNYKKQYDTNKNNVIIDDLTEKIKNLEDLNTKYQKHLNKINSKILDYDKLINILSENGIRKNIIKTIVDPINVHLSKYLIELQSKYHVKLDDNFDAIITERYNEDIHIESLSTGEARKINIAIAISYIEMIIQMNKKTNILFLDEVFASVDTENIDLILNILRDFSKNNKTNIIIVNHTPFDNNKFDKVINIKKINGFSFLG